MPPSNAGYEKGPRTQCHERECQPPDRWSIPGTRRAGPGRQLKARLKAGEVLIAGIVSEYARPSLVKLYGQAGFDFVYIEYEHIYFDPTALADTVLAARDAGLPPIAKTPQLERAEVAKLLEAGIVGIQLPRTESREQVEELRGYLRFPPVGTRAVAPQSRQQRLRPRSPTVTGARGWPARTQRYRSSCTSKPGWHMKTPRISSARPAWTWST